MLQDRGGGVGAANGENVGVNDQGIIYPDSHRNLRTKNACMRLKFSLARENLRHGTQYRD